MSKAERENRRYEHKRDRQAARAALRGDHVKQPLTSRWGHRPDDVPIVDEAQQARQPTSKKPKNCKAKKGGKHDFVTNPAYKPDVGWYRNPPFICKVCKRTAYSTAGPEERRLWLKPPDHWSMYNIQRRLAGDKCRCSDCVDSRTEN